MKWATTRWSMTEATAYGRGGAQIGHSARGIVDLAAQMRCVAGRGNECIARLMRLTLKSVRKI